MEEIDNKIKNILEELSRAVQAYSEKYIDPVIKHTLSEPTDFFELALAQDKINLLETQFKLYLGEKYPNSFSQQQIDFWKKDKDKYTKRIRAWENREFPTREE